MIGLLLVRLLLRDVLLRSGWMQQRRGSWEALERAISREGAGLVIALLRLSPAIPFMPATMLLALTDVPLLPYLVGTVVGLIPFTLICELRGVSERARSTPQSVEHHTKTERLSFRACVVADAYVGKAGRELLHGGMRNPKVVALTAVGAAATAALTLKINAVVSKALSEAQS